MNRDELIRTICTMSNKDRNKKCPCGSEKKFKKCCQYKVNNAKQMFMVESRMVENENIKQ